MVLMRISLVGRQSNCNESSASRRDANLFSGVGCRQPPVAHEAQQPDDAGIGRRTAVGFTFGHSRGSVVWRGVRLSERIPSPEGIAPRRYLQFFVAGRERKEEETGKMVVVNPLSLPVAVEYLDPYRD